jgi:WD40 repeat protein/tetratricopeptide (TPR) repeat protein
VTEPATTAAPGRFARLEELRAAHDHLLRQGDLRKGEPAFWDEVRGFITRACATGAVLDDDAERYAAGGLITYWVNVLYRADQEPPEDTTLAEFDEAWCPELDESRPPYLAPGENRQGQPRLLYGWQRLVRECLGKLQDNGLLAVVGGPASGRNWLVTRGLLPALADGALPGSGEWRILPPVTPGEKPLEDLARVVAPGSAGEAQRLREDAGQLGRLLGGEASAPAVLYVDRFEQLFTLGSRDHVQPFIDGLLAAAAGGRHRVILTLRSDYVGHVSASEALAPAVERGRVFIAFTARELRQAIEEPAKEVGLRFDPGLVDRLLLDVQGDPAAATLLQFTLWQLWENRTGNRVTREAYERLGAGRIALERAAERVYQGLEKQGDGEAARRVWTALVAGSVGGGYRAGSAGRAQLHAAGQPAERVDRVLDRLVAARLVTRTPGAAPPLDRFAPAHEALIGHWPRLEEWLGEERDQRRRWLRLRAAAEQWRDSKEDRALLWGGLALTEAEGYPGKDELQEKFLAASRKDERRKHRLKAAVVWTGVAAGVAIVALAFFLTVILVREHETERRKKQVALSMSRMSVDAGMHLAEKGDVAGAVTWYANALELLNQNKSVLPLKKREILEENHRLRLGMELRRMPGLSHLLYHERMSNAVFSPDGKWAATTASESVGHEPSGGKIVYLWDLTSGERHALDHGDDQVNEACFSGDGRYLVTAGGRLDVKGSAQVWRVSPNPKRADRVVLPTPGVVTQVECNPGLENLRVLLVLQRGEGLESSAGEVVVWNLQGGKFTGRPRKWQPSGGGIVTRAAFRPPAGDRVVAAIQIVDTGRVSVWDTGTGREVHLEQHPDRAPVLYVSFVGPSAGGNRRWFMTCGGRGRARKGEAILWDGGSDPPRRLGPPLAHDGAVVHAAFNRSGDEAITSSQDGTACVWRLTPAGASRIKRLVHGGDVNWAEFSPDERYVVTACRDGLARVWDVESGNVAYPYLRHAGAVSYARFSEDARSVFAVSTAFSNEGQQIVTGHAWELLGDGRPAWYIPATGTVQHVSFDGTGDRLVTVALDKEKGQTETRVWRAKDAWPLSPPLLNNAAVKFATVSGTGARVVTISGKTAYLWEVQTGKQFPLLRHNATVNYACFSADGSRLATVAGDEGSASGEVTIWDARNGRRAHVLCRRGPPVLFAAFSREGERLVAVGGDVAKDIGRAEIWDLGTKRSVTLEKVHKAPVLYAAFNNDNSRVITASADDRACVWNVRTGRPAIASSGRPLILEKHTADVVHASFSPDGNHVATASVDGTALVWDLKTGHPLMTLDHGGSVNAAAFSPDGRYIVTASRDRTARIWDLRAQEGGTENVPVPTLISVLKHPGAVVQASFPGGGASLHTLSYVENDKSAGPAPRFQVWFKEWKLRAEQGEVTEVLNRALLAVNRSIDKQSRTPEVLTADQFWKAWETNKQAYHASLDERRDRILFHRREANKADVREKLPAALWHLDRAIGLARGREPDLFGRRGAVHSRLEKWHHMEGRWGEAKRHGEGAVHDFGKAIQAFEQEDKSGLNKEAVLSRLYVLRAKVFSYEGQLRKAKRDYEESVRRYKDDPRVWMEKAQIHLQLGEREDALGCYDTALILHRQTDTKDQELHALRAKVYAQLQRWDDVIQDCTLAIDNSSGTAETGELHHLRAQAWARTGQVPKAIHDYLEAARRYRQERQAPQSKERSIAAYTSALKLAEQALAIPSQMLTAPPVLRLALLRLAQDRPWSGIGEIRKARGELFAELGRWRQAVDDLGTVTALDWRLRQKLAQGYTKLRRWQEAARAYEEAIRQAPEGERFALWQAKALAHRAAGEWQEAGLAFDEAILRAPADQKVGLWRAKAQVLAAAGQWPEAVKAYTEALRVQKDDPTLLQMRALAYERAGRLDDAIQDYDKAIALQPRWAWLYESRARLYEFTWRWDRAVEDYDRAVNLLPRSAALHGKRALARAEQGNRPEAEADIGEAVRLSPCDPWVLGQLSLIRLLAGDQAGYLQACDLLRRHFGQTAFPATANNVAWALVRGEKPADPAVALRLARKAVAAAPGNPSYLNTLGAAHYRAGEYDEARKRLNESVEKRKAQQQDLTKGPTQEGWVEDWLFLALTYHRLDRPQEAKQWLAKAAAFLDADEKTRGKNADSQWSAARRAECRLLRKEAEKLLGTGR